ncbi:MAG: MBL fold metallo-hydrolase [Bacillota bacterium]
MANRKTIFRGKNANIKLIALVLVIVIAAIFVLFGEDIIGTKTNSDTETGGVTSYTTTDPAPSSGVVDLDDSTFSVHFVDIGQGDAIVVRLPDGVDIIVDAGSGTNESSATTDDYLAYLSAIDIGTIDYMIITHAHSDHMNMADNVLTMFDVENIYFNDYDTEPTTNYYQEFLTAVDKEGANIERFDEDGDIYVIESAEGAEEEYTVTIFAPGYDRDSNTNNNSPFILVEYAGRSLLLTGDAEVEAEEWFIEYCQANKIEINIDLLKVGHHGSSTSSSQAFIEFIDPEYGVISSGAGNSYGHPTAETMATLAAYGVATYRTDTHGDVVFVVDSEGNFVFMVQNAVSAENNTANFEEYMVEIS